MPESNKLITKSNVFLNLHHMVDKSHLDISRIHYIKTAAAHRRRGELSTGPPYIPLEFNSPNIFSGEGE